MEAAKERLETLDAQPDLHEHATLDQEASMRRVGASGQALYEDATLDQEASMRRHAHPHPTLDAEPESKVSERVRE